MCVCCFFFSSRRRHTRFDCDWSSDVCSSDLPIYVATGVTTMARVASELSSGEGRSEEHTSELQSQSNLVCRLLLEKKKKKKTHTKVLTSQDSHHYHTFIVSAYPVRED